jgi:hypothetical protein
MKQLVRLSVSIQILMHVPYILPPVRSQDLIPTLRIMLRFGSKKLDLSHKIHVLINLTSIKIHLRLLLVKNITQKLRVKHKDQETVITLFMKILLAELLEMVL